MHTLKNDKLKIAIKNIGAELCEISSVKHNTQFMWDANPDVWGSFAPNLFPVIGALKNGSLTFEGETYNTPRHGFIRHSKDITLYNKTDNSLTFKLKSNAELLKIYPFKFEFLITFTLTDNTLNVSHTVKNTDTKTMYFSLGGHPAFKCPVFENEAYDDYFLEFEHKENSSRYLIELGSGLILNETEPVFNNDNILPLKHELFDVDALVFKDLKSRKISINSKNNGKVLTVSYPKFNYMGIWAKPNGDYVCIEPWLGIADNVNASGNLKEKEGILSLEAGSAFEASYSIEIEDKHLV
ncbi:aldose epimerase [Tamlana sedimentorum]|uniref:Aldose epimerase n=1 Tax=Neotamlana sedimentorum TaxID=1435349 RepID=A0A0D7WF04_9FLAO|nr:aldose 1-epimerase family protein [Tamlana sedimentorum]KJD36307.1 aldose epimerase [Tamlana sedimentorum]